MPRHIPVAPHPPHSGSTSSGSSSPSSSSSSNSSPGSSGGHAPNTYQSMYAQQKRDQKKAQHKASSRYLAQAHTLSLQAKALRVALGKHGFLQALNQQLANLDLVTGQQDLAMRRDYRTRLGSLEQSNTDNEVAAGAQTYANLTNRTRERSNALSEATANGAGESDLLRAQSASLANWNSNQNEINRSFYDTRSSINAGVRDLNTDTRTARINNALAADSDRGQLWQTYHNQRSESLTQLGNTLGQMADYYGMAKEQDGRGGKKQKRATRAYGRAVTRAAVEAGQAYDSPGVPKKILNWQGHSDFEGQINNSGLSSQATDLSEKKPEGATLRSWT